MILRGARARTSADQGRPPIPLPLTTGLVLRIIAYLNRPPRSGSARASKATSVHGDLFAMAAAYLFHVVQNHLLVDGNIRALRGSARPAGADPRRDQRVGSRYRPGGDVAV